MSRRLTLVPVFTCLLALLCAPSLHAEETWTSLFDGKTLAGWHNPYPYGKVWVEDGAICVQADKKFFLISDKSYSDFILEAEIMLPAEGKANSGVMLRCHVEGAGTDKTKVYGYQSECDPSERAWAGGFYDEARRLWIHPVKGDEGKVKLYQAPQGKWIKYRLECIGDHLKFFVDGNLTSDERDSMDLTGPLGLQHHGEKGQIYRFRNIRIQDLGKHAWKPLTNGKDLTGWEPVGPGKWEVKDGVIHGSQAASEKIHSVLLSKADYSDFTVRAQFQIAKGDSGFYFRAEPVKGNVSVQGFQVEVDTSNETGGLYETNGREWVVKPDPEQIKKLVKKDKWNELTLSAHGGWIVVKINGIKTAELRDDTKGRKEGRFALQLHAGQDMDVQFKDIELLTKDSGAGTP